MAEPKIARSARKVSSRPRHASNNRRLSSNTIVRRSRNSAFLTILGQKFSVEEQNGEKILTHPKWSLTGSGMTLADAQRSLLDEANDIAVVYLKTPDADLTSEALQLKHFLAELFA